MNSIVFLNSLLYTDKNYKQNSVENSSTYNNLYF